MPIGTVPIYQALERSTAKAEDLTWEIFRDTLIEQAEQGVDYFTIHARRAAALRADDGETHDRHVARRFHPRQNGAWHTIKRTLPTRTLEEICEIMKAYDVAFSLGDGSAARFDCRRQRRGQFAELETSAS